MKVLKTIPWDKVDIEVLSIESNHFGEISEGSEEDIQNYMQDQGYVYFHTVGIDQIYIRQDLFNGKYKPDLRKLDEFYRYTKYEIISRSFCIYCLRKLFLL